MSRTDQESGTLIAQFLRSANQTLATTVRFVYFVILKIFTENIVEQTNNQLKYFAHNYCDKKTKSANNVRWSRNAHRTPRKSQPRIYIVNLFSVLCFIFQTVDHHKDTSARRFLFVLPFPTFRSARKAEKNNLLCSHFESQVTQKVIVLPSFYLGFLNISTLSFDESS